MIRRLLDDLTCWCTTRNVTALDLDLMRSGDRYEIGAHLGRRWWKRVIYIQAPRDDLDVLADMIRDMLADDAAEAAKEER